MIKAGQRYKARKDLDVICMTSWAAPFTGGAHQTLPAGEVFVISHDPAPSASAVYCDPQNYRSLQKVFVPLADRLMFWVYRGYYLCIDLKDIAENCRLLGDEIDRAPRY